MFLPQRLRLLRSLNDMSQAHLARASGVAESTIAALETGLNSNPNWATITAICEVFEVSYDYLMGIDQMKMIARYLRSGSPENCTVRELRIGVKCEVCDHLLKLGEPHGLSACFYHASKNRRSSVMLAASMGIGRATVDQLIQDEADRRNKWNGRNKSVIKTIGADPALRSPGRICSG